MQSSFHKRVLLNLERLRILRDLALLSDHSEIVYDKLTQYASDIIGTPVSLVSMVASDYRFFKSFDGLPEPWASRRSTPLSHSFCQHVVMSNKPLIIEDAREVDFLKKNLAIPDLNVIGYLGIPLTLSTNQSLGSFCVIDSQPRQWTEDEIEIMRELAEVLTAEFETRANMNLNQATADDLTAIQDKIQLLIETVKPTDNHEQVLRDIRAFRREHSL